LRSRPLRLLCAGSFVIFSSIQMTLSLTKKTNHLVLLARTAYLVTHLTDDPLRYLQGSIHAL
jgi:hypothetical protein